MIPPTPPPSLRQALAEIIAMAPKENPGPAYDSWGYKSAGNSDDIARDCVDEALWKVAEIARSALAADDAAGGWRDISTAPYNQSILLFAITDEATGNWKMETGWRSLSQRWNWEGRWLATYELKPTHWMPLPPAPASEKEQPK